MQIETAVLRDWGHWAAGATGLLDESNACMRSPISPPPLKKLRSVLIKNRSRFSVNYRNLVLQTGSVREVMDCLTTDLWIK
jgi:hypothetical protein